MSDKRDLWPEVPEVDLVWLEFWFDWALQNCKNPCFANM